MRSSLRISGCELSLPILCILLPSCDGETEGIPAADVAAHAARRLAKGPVAFVPNLGQWGHPARYVARIGGTSVFLEERAFLLSAVERATRPLGGDRWLLESRDVESANDEPVCGAAVRLAFSNAEVPELVPEQVLAGHHDYFLGNDPSHWRTEVPLYGAVRYRGAWPGVEVLCYGRGGHLEYDVVVAPGADLQAVEFEVEGAEGLSIDAEGALVINTAVGPLRQPRPTTYSLDRTGARRALAADYELHGKNRFGFVAPAWNGEEALVVDPGILWSTFVGDLFTDDPIDLSVDASGVVTICGVTGSANYPTTPGAWSTTVNNVVDAFITRLDPSRVGAQQLVYSTFFGGSQAEFARALAVDPTGIVTISGSTSSPDLPTTPGAWDPTFNDTFVAILDPSLQGARQLVYSTFLGGSGGDRIERLATDASGVVTATGWTRSTDYPTTPGAWDTTYNGGLQDAFVTRLDPSQPSLQQLVYSTFLGGNGSDAAQSLSVDPSGIVTVVGGTDAPDYPTTAGAWNASSNGGGDVFITRLDPSLPSSQQLLYSTFVGGTESDGALAVSVSGSVVTIAGGTSSDNYPTTPGAWNTAFNGFIDALVTRLDTSLPSSQQLLYSTFIGGASWDVARELTVGRSGEVTLAGDTNSPDFPTTPGAWDTSHNGGTWDAFVIRLDPSRPAARQILYSTFLGGDDLDGPTGLAEHPDGSVTVSGSTFSANYPTTPGAWDTTYGGRRDGFVTRLDMLPTGVTRFGSSSPGCNGQVAIDVTSMPSIGNQDFSITCKNAPANVLGWFLAAGGGLSTPMSVLGAGIWVDPNSAFIIVASAASNNVGAVEVPLPVPPNPALAGFTLYAQFAWLGPSSPAPCPPTGASSSAALEIVVQP